MFSQHSRHYLHDSQDTFGCKQQKSSRNILGKWEIYWPRKGRGSSGFLGNWMWRWEIGKSPGYPVAPIRCMCYCYLFILYLFKSFIDIQMTYCIYLKCTVWYVWTYISTRETVTCQANIHTHAPKDLCPFVITLVLSVPPLPLLPSPRPHWSALCHYTLICNS